AASAGLLSPDGRHLLTVSPGDLGGERAVHLWEVPSGRPVARRPTPRGATFRGAAFGPDGRCFFLLQATKKGNPPPPKPAGVTIQLLEVRTGDPPLPPLDFPGPVEQAAWSANGGKLATVVVEQVPGDKGARPRW